MHCHTKEGSLDGKVEIEEYIRILKEKGYQGMLVSDHNSYNGYRYWRDHIKGKKYTDFVVLKGIEYDTNNAGHFLVILPEGVKPRILEMRGMPVELLTRVVHAYGGILGPAHPFGEKYLSFGSSKKYQRNPKIMQEFDFLEAYNSCEVEERNQEAKKAARKYFLAMRGHIAYPMHGHIAYPMRVRHRTCIGVHHRTGIGFILRSPPGRWSAVSELLRQIPSGAC